MLDLVEIRRDIHMHPETAFTEERTAGVISRHLQTLGLAARRCAGTGVVAEIDSGKPGPLVALRADIDALPVQEQTGLSYASRTAGKSHACGHDTHIAMLLGAAERLCSDKSNWRGRVRLLFQPAEESVGGAAVMVKEGALEGVSAIFGLHNDPSLPLGRVGVEAGPVMAAADAFNISINGKGGHAAMPHQTTDPLVAAAAVTMALQTIVSHVTDPLQPLVVSVGRFQAGTTFNVIPEKAELSGTARYFDMTLGERLPDILKNTVNNVASGYRCHAVVEYEHMVPPVINDADMAALVKEVCQGELGEENVVGGGRIMGAEDFAIYQQHVPGCFFKVGSAGPYGYHHPAFTVDEGCLAVGASLLAQIARVALLRL